MALKQISMLQIASFAEQQIRLTTCGRNERLHRIQLNSTATSNQVQMAIR